MKTRSIIFSELASNLSDSTWQQLKKSLVGKELLSIGTEIIYASYLVKQALQDSVNYKNADYPSLISLGRMNNVCISNIEPSYIRLRIDEINKIYKPFDLTYTVGNVTFTNIDYVKSGEDIVLYQGLVKTCYSNSKYSDISGYRVDQSIDWEVTTLFDNENNIIRYLQLGKAMPESVYFFKYVNASTIISKFNSLKYGSSIESYKLITIPNGTISAELGDGVWATNFAEGGNYQLIWLELTSDSFSDNGQLSSSEYGSLSNFTVLASHLGKEDSTEYARMIYQKQVLQNSVISSKNEIIDFVKTFAYVLDASVTAEGERNITVYIKPKDPNDTGTFDEIRAVLDYNGLLFVNNNVRLGTPIEFTLVIKGIDDTVTQNNVAGALLSYLSYESLPYNYELDVAQISAYIQSNFRRNSLVRVLVNQTLADDMIFYPEVGTVRLYDKDGNLAAWDNNGILQGKGTKLSLDRNYFGLTAGGNLMTQYYKFETGVSTRDYILLNAQSGCARDITSLIYEVFHLKDDVNSSVYVISNNGYVILYESVSTDIAVFDEKVFWNYPEIKGSSQMIPLLKTNNSDPNGEVSKLNVDFNIARYYPTIVYDNKVIYYVTGKSGDSLCLHYATSDNGLQMLHDYFVKVLGAGFDLGGVIRNGDDLLIFGIDGHVLVVYDFMNPGLHTELLTISNTISVSEETTGTVFLNRKRMIVNHYGSYFIIRSNDHIYIAEGCVYDSAGFTFTSFKDITNGLNPTKYVAYNIIGGTDEYAILAGVENKGTDYELVAQFFSFNQGVWLEPTVYPGSFYEVENVGDVDYLDGVISYTGSLPVSDLILKYESTSSKALSSKNYLKLNINNPVVWK